MSAAANTNSWESVSYSRTRRTESGASPWSSASRRPEAPAAFARTSRQAPPPPPSSTAASRERAAEAARAVALDFSSATAYPSLSSSRAPATTTTTTATLNYRSAIVSTEAQSATAAADAYEVEYVRRRQERLVAEEAERVRRARLAAIGTRSFDDGPEDYDGPDEDEDEEGYVPAGTGTTDDWEEDASGNVVEDQVAIRRRGDKGVW